MACGKHCWCSRADGSGCLRAWVVCGHMFMSPVTVRVYSVCWLCTFSSVQGFDVWLRTEQIVITYGCRGVQVLVVQGHAGFVWVQGLYGARLFG